jgi:hypothetical protein
MMKFRLTIAGLHLLTSAIVLSLILGALYFGWYRWPGWYLTDAAHLVPVLVGVDLALGPAITFIIAASSKSRRELTRDIAMIVCVQLIALAYGTATLWHGRPLYYAFSENVLEVVQESDLNARESALARGRHADLAPHWYSRPRWIWAPLPTDPQEQEKIISSAAKGGEDVISFPGYFRPWEQGLPALRGQLRKVDDLNFYSTAEKASLKQRMRASGLAVDAVNSIPLMGRGRLMLAVFDTANMTIIGMFEAH